MHKMGAGPNDMNDPFQVEKARGDSMLVEYLPLLPSTLFSGDTRRR